MDNWKPQVIVLGYDGTAGSERAAALAASLAQTYGASMVVATAFRPFPRITEPTDKDALEIERARTVAESKAEELRALGIEVRISDLEGPADQAILNSAEAWKADLIVLGSRGHGPLAGLLLGSISQSVAHHATVPVLIAR